MMFFNSFYHIEEELKNFANQNRILISKDIEYAISSWLEERVNNLESSVKYLEQDANFKNEEALKAFIRTFMHENRYFDAIQIMLPDLYFYVNEIKWNDYRINPNYVGPMQGIPIQKNLWFTRTKEQMKTTISSMTSHGYLREKTMNICTPVAYNGVFEGVMCGIIKAEPLFGKIEKLKFPQKAYYFISSDKGSLFTCTENAELSENIRELFYGIDPNSNEPQEVTSKDDVITITKLKQFDWYIGVGMNKKEIMRKSGERLTVQAGLLFSGLILLLIIINLAHEFLRRRVEKKQIEYEYFLAHRSRISEIGELISGVNHQLRQPINATALVVSSTLDLSERSLLDKETLEENLKLCQKSINLMDKTIGIFRNFYRYNDAISEFSLLECVKSVIHVNYIELAKHSINIEMDERNIEGVMVTSIENFIQQILLVLIQNAKDALIILEPLAKNLGQKKIHIAFNVENGVVSIDVSDWGGGVCKEDMETLFMALKSSKKYGGTGIGLYFSKKLAKEKLLGDLTLVSCKLPTTFRLTFPQKIIHKG